MTDDLIKEYRSSELATEDDGQNRQPVKKLLLLKLATVKSALKNIKKPKFITLGILIITAAVVILAMNLASQEEKEETPTTQAQIASPSPSPSGDSSLENIAQRVKAYTDRLDNLQEYQKKIIYPIVDLEINFEK